VQERAQERAPKSARFGAHFEAQPVCVPAFPHDEEHEMMHHIQKSAQ
jgi:hypothetical protein